MSGTNSLGVEAYARAAQRTIPTGLDDAGSISAAGVSSGKGFGALIGDMVTDAVQATRHSDVVSRQAVTGKADLVDVVSAVSAAELALESVVAVRDRAISAYQELMRMQI